MYFEMYRQEFPDDVNNPKIIYDLVEAYEAMGEPAIAMDVCEEFVQAYPDDTLIDKFNTKLQELQTSFN